jgi:hypothetical protein
MIVLSWCFLKWIGDHLRPPPFYPLHRQCQIKNLAEDVFFERFFKKAAARLSAPAFLARSPDTPRQNGAVFRRSDQEASSDAAW